ncbi:MAG: portal protein, partial [Nanoarchaeota archaeon]
CTYDHRLLMRDGTYKEAQNIIERYDSIESYDSKYRQVCRFEDAGVRVVYDLEVPGFNNFAIAYQGNPLIFIHNSRLARYSDYSEMDSFSIISSALDIYCLAGDTVIPLLNGEKITIKELFEQQKQNFWVYSYDTKNNKYVPGLCKKSLKTGTNQPVFKITFDDGLFVKLTENHLVLLKSGEYKRVKELQFGDSIRSVYTKLSTGRGHITIKDYEMILQDSGKWKFTHRLIAEHFDSKGKGVVHHKDFRKWNNDPENLQFMLFEDHKNLHAKTNTERWENNERYREKMSGIFSAHAKKMWANKEWAAWKRKYHSDFLIKMYQDHPEMKELVKHVGADNGRYVSDILNDDILSFGTKHEQLKVFAENFDFKGRQFKNKKGKIQFLKRRIIECGYKTWKDYKQNYIPNNNHKVVSVSFSGNEDVYDLEVQEYHNFAIGNNVKDSYVVVHNSDEVCTKNEYGNIVSVHSSDSSTRKILESLLYDVLNIDFNLWTWTRNLIKYGDQFLMIDHHPDYGVLGLIPMPVNETEREEGFDPKDPMAYRFRWITQGNRTLEPWRVAHFRIQGNDNFFPYGCAVIEAARRTWRQVTLLEDAIMVYRIVRCGSGESNIWIENGYKKLKNIKIGDKVYSFDYNINKLVLSSVTNVINNGKQQLWLVKSKHRSFKANFNHPVLVKDKFTNTVKYVQMNRLVEKRYQLVLPKNESKETKTLIGFNENNVYEWFAYLNKTGQEYIYKNRGRISNRSFINKISKEINYPFNRVKQFLYKKSFKGIKGIPYEYASFVC